MVKSGKEAGGAGRRKEPRYDRSLPVRVADDSPDGLKAESINISTRGLYCRTKRYVAPFAKLKVAMELPFASRDPATVECEGVVVRVEPQTEALGGKEYRVAVYFLNVERETQDLIAQYIEESH